MNVCRVRLCTSRMIEKRLVDMYKRKAMISMPWGERCVFCTALLSCDLTEPGTRSEYNV